MYRIHRVLSVLFILGICLAGASYSAEEMKGQSKMKAFIAQLFGKQEVEYFEQMFEDGKIDFSYRSSYPRTPGVNILHYAAASGDLNRVKELIKQGADINVKDHAKRTVLNYAALSGNLELVKWLVEHGLDVKAKNDNKETVLHSAAIAGNLELVKWLVEHGLDVKAKNDNKETVLKQKTITKRLFCMQPF